MVSVSEANPEKLIMAAAKELEKIKEMQPPEWAKYVKTGIHKERPPQQENWWFIRAAAVLRKVYLNPGIGVSRLRKEYGGRKNRGHQPEHKYRGSGSVIRKVLQSLEKAGFIKTENRKGRFITPKGQSFLHKIVKSVK